MTTTQTSALNASIANAGTGWKAAWILTHAASHVAAISAETLPFVDAIPLLLASADLRAAEDYLEQARRHLPPCPTAPDIPSADLQRDAASAHRAVEQLVRAALETVRHLRSAYPAGVAAVDLAHADSLLCAACRQLVGSRP